MIEWEDPDWTPGEMKVEKPPFHAARVDIPRRANPIKLMRPYNYGWISGFICGMATATVIVGLCLLIFN